MKHKAQLEIMAQLSNTLLAWQEREGRYLTKAESDGIEKEIRIQADRVAKAMGYTKAWHE